MIERTGCVRAIFDDHAIVEVYPQDACSSCATGCARTRSSRLSSPSCVEARDLVGVQVGEQVVIAIHESTLVRGTLMVYGIPLIGFIAGVVGGSTFGGGSDGFAILGGIAGLLVGFLIIKTAGRVRQSGLPREMYQTLIIQRVDV